MKSVPTVAFLARRREIIIADMKLKTEAEDWHGVADGAMDLREIDATLALLAAQEHEAEAAIA